MFQAVLCISEYLYRIREMKLMFEGKMPLMVEEKNIGATDKR